MQNQGKNFNRVLIPDGLNQGAELDITEVCKFIQQNINDDLPQKILDIFADLSMGVYETMDLQQRQENVSILVQLLKAFKSISELTKTR